MASETILTPQIKSNVNPLYQPRYRERSVQSANMHINRLNHKNADYKYVLIGDSMFERYLSSGSGKSFNDNDEEVQNDNEVNLWEKYHKMNAVNLGVAGDGVSEILHRLYKLNIIGMLPKKPERIVVWVGANDIDRYTEDVVFDGIVNLVDRIKTSYIKDLDFDPRIGVVSLLPKFPRKNRDGSKGMSVSDLNRSIQRLNYKLAKHAQDTKLFDFLDVYYEYYQNYKIVTDLYQDGTHLNNQGYQHFDKKFQQFLTQEGNEGNEVNDNEKPKYRPRKNEGNDREGNGRDERQNDDVDDSKLKRNWRKRDEDTSGSIPGLVSDAEQKRLNKHKKLLKKKMDKQAELANQKYLEEKRLEADKREQAVRDELSDIVPTDE
jgi:lysophospholipase L1-like esterase